MNREKLLLQTVTLALAIMLLLACGTPTSMPAATATSTPTSMPTSTPAPTATSTPTFTPSPTPAPISISGRAYAASDSAQPAVDRKIVLCLVKEIAQQKDDPFVMASCILDADLTTVTDGQGRFEFHGLPNESYMILYDDTLEDFESGLPEWDEETISLLDDVWLAQFESQEGGLPLDMQILDALGSIPVNVLFMSTLLETYIGDFPGFPFLIAAKLDLKATAFAPVVAEIKDGQAADVEFEMFGGD